MSSSLFDKLQSLSRAPIPADPKTPIESDWAKGWEKPTGAFCSVCNEPQYDTPGGACCKNGHGGAESVTSGPITVVDVGTVSGSKSVLERLRALGDAKQVNPPSDVVVPDSVPVTETKTSSTEGAVCPTCGKTFKHLSRHKCKPSTEAKSDEKFLQSLDNGSSNGFMLVLDALFEKVPNQPMLFCDIIAPLAAAVAKENGVPHWAAVDYGKGSALLAAKLQAWLLSAQPHGTILADSSTPELRAVKEVLKRAAAVIIQGVR